VKSPAAVHQVAEAHVSENGKGFDLKLGDGPSDNEFTDF
jgi:hypothetical protein